MGHSSFGFPLKEEFMKIKEEVIVPAQWNIAVCMTECVQGSKPPLVTGMKRVECRKPAKSTGQNSGETGTKSPWRFLFFFGESPDSYRVVLAESLSLGAEILLHFFSAGVYEKRRAQEEFEERGL